jgi:hypothetical protein
MRSPSLMVDYPRLQEPVQIAQPVIDARRAELFYSVRGELSTGTAGFPAVCALTHQRRTATPDQIASTSPNGHAP